MSPEEIDNWYNIDFDDRAEYMRLSDEVDRQYDEWVKHRNG